MNIAIIFAGGVGSRMKIGDGTPKQFLQIDGVPILIYTLRVFQDEEMIDKIVVVMKKEYIERTKRLIEEYDINKAVSVVEGGNTGQESIYNGLVAAKNISEGKDDIVLIHDGVRPFIDGDLIRRNISAVREYGSAISCAPSKETVVEITGDGDISRVIDRKDIWLARAPQCFYLDDIFSAHERARKQGKVDVIDSCTMMMEEGKSLHIVETSAENIKITTPEDFYVATGLIMHKGL